MTMFEALYIEEREQGKIMVIVLAEP